MDPFHFACPHCLSPLRVREKLFVGRQVDCPACGDLLLIVERGGGMEVERIERKPEAAAPDRRSAGQTVTSDAPQAGAAHAASANAAVSPSANQPAASAGRPATHDRWRALLTHRPTIVALVAVALLVGGVGVWGLSALFVGTTGESEGLPADAPASVAANGDGQDLPPLADVRPAKVERPRDDLKDRLLKLGETLLVHAAEEKEFPAAVVSARGVAPENRLSWLAAVADRLGNDSAPVPAWDRAWNDPQNDAFVRRRLVAFQNPHIPQLTGADGYPATHFVGVAGVGADAAKLDPRDPRAGIFNNNRPTRVEEITDGAANTLLVMGVHDQLGSWAAGGSSTVRGLAREPYVNGPDGFGTGQADSMLVLMADGSVRTVGGRMDPRLLRRMAAKADGLALDESVPGEPAEQMADQIKRRGDPVRDGKGLTGLLSSAAALGDAGSGGKGNADGRPIEPEFVPEPVAGQEVPPVRKFDLALSLKQPIARFDQPRSKPLEEVLASVAEMAGTEIAFNREELGPAAARLREPIALSLVDTTVGEILAGLLRPAGLGYRIEGNRLRIIPAGP